MNFDEILQMYDKDTPKLLLFEAKKTEPQQIDIEELSKLNGCLATNPIDIVLESWINVLSERISVKDVTMSRDRALLNAKINNEAVEQIKRTIGDDGSKLKVFHDLWLKKFADAF